MISQVPLDPMHVIDLGVTRKMLNSLVKKKVKVKTSRENKNKISKLLISLKKFITKDFARLPRTLDELSNWKATEFRQFILYTGILVLKDLVDDDFYYTFLLLHCAVRMLSCPKYYLKNIETADNILKIFVHNFAVVFGPENISYNVHALLHISDCVREHGALYNFSAYDFENHLQMMKKDVRKPTHILQQLYIRNFRSNKIAEDIELGIREKDNIIYQYKTKDFLFSVKEPDNICLLPPYTPFKITSFIKNNQANHILIAGKCFKSIKPFFIEPTDSILSLGISVTDNVLEENEKTFNVNEISCKLLSLPCNNNLVFIPILHGCN